MKVLLCMIYLHLLDDYVLQGVLAKLKQKDFWRPFDKQYRYDYIIALLEHGFMNSFMVHIPIYVWLCKNELILSFSVCAFAIIHALIDDLKANDKKINLITDQLTHLFLILLWWIIFTIGGML